MGLGGIPINKHLFIGLGIVGLIAVVIYIQASTPSGSSGSNQPASNQVLVTNTPNQQPEDRAPQYSPSRLSRYLPYSLAAFEESKDKKRVLYFHADWCAVCRPLDKEFSANTNAIPQNVVLYKANYDSETALKKKYAVIYQHTFVQVDTQGNEVTKWNGGGIEELMENIK